ncbi:ice-binding family protein [Aurantimonas sp. C2-6-R+9]|uniref:ice-binding family protein n=1 Tax=Aurantimonas sp. C2-5-R2 TaxID=3113713 RepID=UPI002EC2BA6E|nr:ice-binding family protein [Aurantimonas sp. C2-6-R+9]
MLAGSTVTNTGTTIINGNVGVSPGTAITGFPPGIVTPPFAFYRNDGVAIQAQIDLTSRFTDLFNRPATVDLTGQDLAGLTLAPGVFNFDTSAQLTGTLTLDAQFNQNAVFIIIIGSTLTTASASTVSLINGAQAANVFFVVGSSATLGTETTLAGQILALTSITLNTGADINCGAALARNGAVTLDTNTISVCPPAVTVPVVPVVTPPGGTPVVTPPGGTPVVTPPVVVVPPTVIAVATGIDAFVDETGQLPLIFRLLTPAQTVLLLEQLTGEVGSSVAPAGRQAMNSFMSQVFDRMTGDEGPYAPERVVQQPEAPATVRVLGYGPEAGTTLQMLGGVAMYGAPVAAPRPKPWNGWISAYGEETRTDGDSYWGTHDREIDTVGVAVGIDYALTPDTIAGFAVGLGRSTFGLDGASGSGESDMAHVAIYGRTNFDAAYVAASIAAGYSDVSTERNLTIGTTERFEADFSAWNLAGRVETGYRFDVPDIAMVPGRGWVTPYASLQVQQYYIPDYSESSDTNSIFALDIDSSDSTGVRTELGARFGQNIPLANDATLKLRSRIAWAHDEVSGETLHASFRALPGSDFQIKGADESGDYLLASAGADVLWSSGLAVGATFDSEVSSDSTTLSGIGRISYRW